MISNNTEAGSMLALDLGNFTTRASFIDVVDGQYRLIAAGEARTTAGAPYFDIRTGVISAVRQIEQVIDRQLVDQKGTMIMPVQVSGNGFDSLVIVYSCVPEMKIAVAGLVSEISLESAQHLVSGLYAKTVETTGLLERRDTASLVDDILQQEPELILLTGGSENGAVRSIGRLTQLVQTVCQFTRRNEAPEVLYAGNSRLAQKVKMNLEPYTRVHVVDNIRPNAETEVLAPAKLTLGDIAFQNARRKNYGLSELTDPCSSIPMQTASGMSLLVQMIHEIKGTNRPVLGVDIGAVFSSISLARHKRIMDATLPLGTGWNIGKLIQDGKIEEIAKWVPPSVSTSRILDALLQKAVYPQIQPVSEEMYAIEQAVLRVILRTLLQNLQARWRTPASTFEPILISGKSLTSLYPPGLALMVALDGLQPSGITTILRDPHGLVPVMGAAGKVNPLIPVQLFDSGAVDHLATTICPVSRASVGTPILQVKLSDETGKEEELVVKQGALVILPIRFNQVVKVHIQGLHGTLVDPLTRTSNVTLMITGGLCGAVIDARGRPLVLPKEGAERWERIDKWRKVFG